MDFSPLHYADNSREWPLVSLFTWISENWFHLLLAGLALHLFFNKNISIRLHLTDNQRVEANAPPSFPYDKAHREKTSAFIPDVQPRKGPAGSPGEKPQSDLQANNFSNLTFILHPGYARKKGVPDMVVEEKRENCLDYVERFSAKAIEEMERYKIPASITLAQGLLESNAGDSRLARESNNHFGIKCRTKCRGCTCRNYTDDDIFDMFRVFDTAQDSYREHSILLNSSRYRHLHHLKKTDYKGWAKGLKKAGYATDKHYAEKLIRIIEKLELYRYDQ